MFPGKGSQARFPGTAPQARLLGRGSQARFPGRGSQARVPSCSWKFCLGTSSSWERLLENLFLRAFVPAWNLAWKRLLGPCLGTVFGNRTCMYLQAAPKNLTLLGNLFLDTCLGASSWELAWEHFSPTASSATQEKDFQSNFPGTGSQARLPGTIPSQVPKNRFPRTGSQARFPSKGSRNSCHARFPGTGSQARFPGTGFQEKVAKKVSKNRFASKGIPGKVPGNRFPSKVRKARFPSKVRKNSFTSKGSKNSASSSQARGPRTGFLAG